MIKRISNPARRIDYGEQIKGGRREEEVDSMNKRKSCVWESIDNAGGEKKELGRMIVIKKI